MQASSAERYGVIGHPVAHSLSPEIHAAFAAQVGGSIDYRRVLAPLGRFVETTHAFFDDAGCGLNVTVPFKLEAHRACGARLSARASKAGAVNWLARDAHGLHGDNTDGAGLVADVERLLGRNGHALRGARVLLLGAGGAARGVIGPLRDARPASLTIANRDPAKAESLVREHAVTVGASLDARPLDALDGAYDVVVNATSASLAGDVPAVAPAVLRDARLVYDMMYGATPTRFLAMATAAGATAVADGLGMLVEQAAESFRLWRGVKPHTAPVRDALRARLSAAA